MRVNELAKELGKTSKEILDILEKHNQAVKSHSSSVSEEQIGLVRRAFQGKAPAGKAESAGGGSGAAKAAGAGAARPAGAAGASGAASGSAGAVRPAGAAGTSGASGVASGTAGAARSAGAAGASSAASGTAGAARAAGSTGAAGTAGASAAGTSGAARPAAAAADGAAPKKKIVAVYRPQNSQQRPARPRPQQGQAGNRGQAPTRPQGAGAASQARPQGAGAASPVRPQGAGAASSVRPQGAGAASPVRPQGAGAASQARSQGAGAASPVRPQGAGAATPVRPQGAGTASSVRPQGAGTAAPVKSQSPAAATPSSAAASVKPQAEEASQAQTSPVRSQSQGTAAPARQQGATAARPQGTGSVQGNRENPVRSQAAGNREMAGGRDGGSRDGRGQGSFGGRDGGSRDGRGQGGFGSRDGGSRDGRGTGARGQGGFGGRDGGSRDGRGQGGFGSRDGGSRDGRSQGGFGGRDGGSRDGRGGQGGFGSRDGGSRDGRGQGGFGSRDGGSRDGRSQGGFGGRDGGSRDGRPGGFGGRDGGSRDGRPGGFGGRDGGSRDGGSRPGGNRGGAARPGQRDSGSRSFDTPLQTKPTSNRQQNKTGHKNDRYDKKNVNEDGPRSKGGKMSKHPFIMPQKPAQKQAEEVVKVITIPEVLTIKDLADQMKLQPSAIIKKLFLRGEIVTMNSEIDFDKAEEIAMEYDVLCEKEEKVDVIAELLKEDEEDEDDMITRPPVVCVMGHVDHGKTSLLDAIRSTNVTAREAGGITQHIGAYTVEINGQMITFLDTPGHEAFTAMRMRGAQSTDIAILVVAADDGVMPQTVEAINHAKAAEVEIIVAINKIDKPSANIERVKQELAEYQLVPEDWGGSTIFVPVSAKTKEGIPDLLEMILLAAEVKELKANPNRKARGLVIEAELDKGKGPVATILVQKGTLRIGDNVTAGACYGKVRAMMDDKGRRVKEAGPSQPVEILGLNDVPGAGDVLMAVENEKEARSYAETFIAESKNKLLEDTKSRLSLDDLFSQIKAGNVKELPIIVKADVQGSVEAVKESLLKLSNEEVVVKVIHGGVGAINESDVSLASASNAIIIGFNVRPDATAKSIAEREKVDLRLYRVIYQAIEDVEAAMKGMLDPVYEEQVIGHAIVRQLFKASGVGTIAGSYVTDGKIQRGCSCRITRGGEQIFEGALASLKRFKDDVKEVATGYECGLVFEKFNDLQEDDTIEAYIMVEVPR